MFLASKHAMTSYILKLFKKIGRAYHSNNFANDMLLARKDLISVKIISLKPSSIKQLKIN